MFHNLSFDLVSKELEKNIPIGDQQSGEVNLQCEIKPTPSGVAGADSANLKSYETLVQRLTDLLPVPQWNISLKIDLNSGRDMVSFVSAKGTFLDALQSIMCHDVNNARLKLKFSAELRVETDHEEYPSDSRTFQHPLLPRMGKGFLEHSDYNHDHCAHRRKSGTSFFQEEVKLKFTWDIALIHLFIEGIEYDAARLLRNINEEVLHTIPYNIFGPKFTILYKDQAENDDPIRVLEYVLCGQSPVVNAMKVEGEMAGLKPDEHKLILKGNSREEVLAFLGLLYVGDVEKPSKDPSMATTLYEMTYCLGMVHLREAMKAVLVTMPIEYYNGDQLLHLFKVAHVTKAFGLKQMASDIVKLKESQGAVLSDDCKLMTTYAGLVYNK